MHELSIATALVTQIEDILKQEKRKNLVSFSLEIGELSGIERDALEFALPFTMETSSFSDAKVIINEIKAEIYCKKCDKNSIPENKFILICPICNSSDVTISKGKQFMLKSLEVNV